MFLHNGLMEYGSAFGHGAYLGPDFTADYLRRSSDLVGSPTAGRPRARPRAGRSRTFARTAMTRTRTLTSPRAGPPSSGSSATTATSSRIRRPSTACGRAITDPASSPVDVVLRAGPPGRRPRNRPGHDYTYTNNWPPEPRVENKPTANVIVWSVLSLIALLGGIGLLFAAFGRWGRLGWHGREQATLSFRTPGDVALTPAQRATAWFFFVMAALFLVQTLVGAASQHYRAELTNFFGFDLAKVLPYNLMRTWHVQLASSGWRPRSSRPASSSRR